MTDTPSIPQTPSDRPRTLWRRGLLMLLMALAFQVASTLLCLLAMLQFVLVLLQVGVNLQLQAFARSLGTYLHQIAGFVGFAAEEVPFPFADWPTGAPAQVPDAGPPT